MRWLVRSTKGTINTASRDDPVCTGKLRNRYESGNQGRRDTCIFNDLTYHCTAASTRTSGSSENDR